MLEVRSNYAARSTSSCKIRVYHLARNLPSYVLTQLPIDDEEINLCLASLDIRETKHRYQQIDESLLPVFRAEVSKAGTHVPHEPSRDGRCELQ